MDCGILKRTLQQAAGNALTIAVQYKSTNRIDDSGNGLVQNFPIFSLTQRIDY
jgi:hypothetical protein